MISRDVIKSLIPHAGGMCLLDEVTDWTAESISLSTRSHQSPENPLRSGGRLRAIHLCEYGAQAMAVHGGLLARAAGKTAQPGFLVSLRDVQLHREYVDDLPGALTVRAERLMESLGSWQYHFFVSHGDESLAEGRAAVIARV